MRRVAVVSVGLAAVVSLSSCGGSPGISPGISSRLQAEVGAVRAAAVSHQVSVAVTRLDQLRLQVALLRQQGQISSAKAAAILTAAAAVQAQLASVGDPATTVPTTVPGIITTTTTPGPSRSLPRSSGGHLSPPRSAARGWLAAPYMATGPCRQPGHRQGAVLGPLVRPTVMAVQPTTVTRLPIVR